VSIDLRTNIAVSLGILLSATSTADAYVVYAFEVGSSQSIRAPVG